MDLRKICVYLYQGSTVAITKQNKTMHNLRIFLAVFVTIAGGVIGWDQQLPFVTFFGLIVGLIIGYDPEDDMTDDLH